MAQVRIRIDDISVAPSFLHAFQNARCFEFGDQSQCGAFCDANSSCHIAQASTRLFRKAYEHMRVVAFAPIPRADHKQYNTGIQ